MATTSPAPPIPNPVRPRDRTARPCGGRSGSRAGRSDRSSSWPIRDLQHWSPWFWWPSRDWPGAACRTRILILQLVGAMLPVQFCIGVINDVADLHADVLAKPHKPLVRGVVTRSTATVAGIALGAIGLGAAATVNLATLGFDALALSAGLAYDLGMRRTPLSWVPWWGGMAVLPLEGYASIGAVPSKLLVVLPLSGLLAIGLHFANALPDIDGDRLAGRAQPPRSCRSSVVRSLLGRSACGRGTARGPPRRPSRPGRIPVLPRRRGARRRGGRSGRHTIGAAVSRARRGHSSVCGDLVGVTPAGLIPGRRLGTIGRRAQVAQW